MNEREVSELQYLAGMDVRYWRMLHKVCPNCGADFEQMHPFSNLVPHWLGQCKPVGAKEQPADGDSAQSRHEQGSV